MFENVRLALSSLRSNKMRALLTMLGIIIGIGSVIAIVTVGQSLTGSITDSMSGLGANNLTVALTQKSTDSDSDQGSVAVRMFGPSAPAAEDLITDEMIEEYRDTFGDQVAAVKLTQSMGTGTVTNGSDSATLNLLGVNGEYFTAEDVDVQYGRAPQDSDGERQVALVSDRFLKDAFGGSVSPINAIGQKFQLKANGSLYDFYVIGVYHYDEEEDGSISLTGSSDEVTTTLYMPLQTAKKLAKADAGYQSLTVVGAGDVDQDQFMADTKSFFASFYTRNQSYTVDVSSLASLLETMTSMLGTVQTAISAIAAISLLVGGIGVMNIMLVSVTERTSEIGLKKALGAKKRRILLQFLTEAAVLTSLGGVIGVATGIGLAELISKMMEIPVAISFPAIGISVAFSTLIGVVFGLLPATQAANLNPIEALRRV